MHACMKSKLVFPLAKAWQMRVHGGPNKTLQSLTITISEGTEIPVARQIDFESNENVIG